MFGIKSKIDKWHEKGIISEKQMDEIKTYEKEKTKKKLHWGIVSLAILAILIGILSIIAANWAHLGKEIKLIAHIIMNIVAAYGIYYYDKKNMKKWREGCLFALFGLNLTMIALIGQVFQLPGDIPNALMLWMVISTPAILLYGKTYVTGVPWILVFPASAMIFIVTHLEKSDISDYYSVIIIQAILVLFPLITIIISRIKIFRMSNPAYSDIFIRISFLFIIGMTTLSTMLWYLDTKRELTSFFKKTTFNSDGESWFLAWLGFNLIYLVAIAGFIAFWKMRNYYINNIEGRGLFLIALTSIITVGLSVSILHDNSDAMGMFFFITYWLIIAIISYMHSFEKLITLAIALIAIRIFIIYLEVFGGLLSTGFGLISSGLVLLAMIYGFSKINKFIKPNKLKEA